MGRRKRRERPTKVSGGPFIPRRGHCWFANGPGRHSPLPTPGKPRRQPRAQSRLRVRDGDHRKRPAEAALLGLCELDGCKHTPETQHGTISYKKTFQSIANPKSACNCHTWSFYSCGIFSFVGMCVLSFFSFSATARLCVYTYTHIHKYTHTHTHTPVYLFLLDCCHKAKLLTMK